MGRVHRLFLDDRPETLGLTPPPLPPRISATPSKHSLTYRPNLFDSLGTSDLTRPASSTHLPRPSFSLSDSSFNLHRTNAVAASAEHVDSSSATNGRDDSDPPPVVKILACKACGTHLSHNGNNNLISKDFHGHHGKAWLMRTVFNTVLGEPSSRAMTTGVHVVADIDCTSCGTTVGWKYVKAMETSQRYKEGCFIIEIPLVTMKQADV
ncbi:hypothetical protein CcCBS67573_g08822 [Chytriomyces confervae]|uniref:Yippee domain-containing protein n=1 Tax=Chytriomyces confervae TaxID=246404 RepID=A0A507EH01_9FUNG|nr:hypothetical protein HDU80_006054 [Chytriomyces hyalinus]TPX62478.1 hypothetical protein CcCBS67573_g08822 [Chytriomyces confervae]